MGGRCKHNQSHVNCSVVLQYVVVVSTFPEANLCLYLFFLQTRKK
uniref:Uncharacterized protein n=1 Tax=Arundo donax TaxID=35708 RepID=A0A0A9EDD1_ARUDO